MAHDHRASDSDQMLTARLMSVAKRHAPWREPTQDETNAEVPELREIAGDRPDLLAEVAGVCSAPVRAGSTSRDRRFKEALTNIGFSIDIARAALVLTHFEYGYIK